MEGDELGGACSMHGTDEKCINVVRKYDRKMSLGKKFIGWLIY
jgi:hypothetical protein